MTRTALLIIDMLRDFIEKDGALYCGPAGEKIVQFIKQKADETRKAGGVVIYITDNHKPDDPEFQMFAKHAVKGTPGAEIISELKPRRGDEVVRKPTLSSFYRTRLDDVLKKHKVKSVVVVGVCTSICVMDTVGDLRVRGYPVTVFKKGVADFDQRMHKIALERMRKTYGAEVM
jgi:nicotinamidase-related amidase